MEHKDIAQLLYNKYGLSGWWSQMVTVQYEQEIKRRKRHEKPEGFQISKSTTLPHSATKIFSAINSPIRRIKWLKDPGITITKSTSNKSIRARWIDKKTTVEFQLYTKDKNKSQLVIQHSKLKTSKNAEKMKIYWRIQLANLKRYLERK